MNEVVLKFGGSSLANPECIRQVAGIISSVYDSGLKPVVIVSAMYGETDRLIRMVESVSGESHSEAYDFLISTGEHTSVALLSMVLKQMGYQAKPRSAWQIGLTATKTSEDTTLASVDTWAIHQMAHQGVIPVITGFQAITDDLMLTTLGRGGSDLSAVMIAEKLGAECHIYTDVRGVYAADPKVIHRAKRLSHVHIDMMMCMSNFGAKVLQYKALEYAKSFKVPLKVLSTFSPDSGSEIYYGVPKLADAVAIQSIDKLIYFRIQGAQVTLSMGEALINDLNTRRVRMIAAQCESGYLSILCPDQYYERVLQLFQLQFKLCGDVDLFTQSQVSAVSVICESNTSIGHLVDESKVNALEVYQKQSYAIYVVLQSASNQLIHQLAGCFALEGKSPKGAHVLSNL